MNKKEIVEGIFKDIEYHWILADDDLYQRIKLKWMDIGTNNGIN